MTPIATAVLIVLIRGYQWTLRPFIGAHCRYEPSCSHYAIEALQRHGPIQGTRLATARILRCNPWHPAGLDPVPPCHCRPGRAPGSLPLMDQT